MKKFDKFIEALKTTLDSDVYIDESQKQVTIISNDTTIAYTLIQDDSDTDDLFFNVKVSILDDE